MSVELIDKMGTDLSVVNAARVSYAKTAEECSLDLEEVFSFGIYLLLEKC